MVSFHCVCTVGQGSGLSSVSQMLLVIRSRACRVYACPATELLHWSQKPFVVWTEEVKCKSCASVTLSKARGKHVGRPSELTDDRRELLLSMQDKGTTRKAMAEVLGAFGVPCEELPDGMIVSGGAPLHAARIESRGDHRIAMSAALLAMLADGKSIIDGAEAVDTSFPGFVALMQSLGANITEESV